MLIDRASIIATIVIGTRIQLKGARWGIKATHCFGDIYSRVVSTIAVE